ncbi:Peptidyl-prolyl cis-trans isomerase PpiC-type [Macrophomina phaseolina MS6]|uniref:Peptidyl-prolyl cis-trans isomerase n=2 Tax=Macrophomina phaseolina TaxID=35725 RepID=K2SKA1_MACPH|nr:Peptidyl-prolyl cis-trans isomerase PpiC-type [Macrophomina phaseolina MS6]KAH7047565.1 peptidyl-prolyl cis-trans isomerase pin4 [Macrophomina phaseolina]
MAPKGKGKGGGKDAGDKADKGSGKLKPATSINVRHILCEKHSKKEEALAKLRDGAKFDDVAREFSEDKARQGGSLGWKTRGSLLPDFEKVAYELEPSTTGSPKYGEVKTSEGYHIVMVEGRK